MEWRQALGFPVTRAREVSLGGELAEKSVFLEVELVDGHVVSGGGEDEIHLWPVQLCF